MMKVLWSKTDFASSFSSDVYSVVIFNQISWSVTYFDQLLISEYQVISL